MNLYNEIDPAKSEWLRELIKRNVIAPGIVDERSILELEPPYATQCHFFAGIGIWSYALRLAGWPDEREVWTGSCPCQPFSVAGKRKAEADERHLWPAWFRLIAERRPVTVFSEQVADGDGQAWLDAVQSDMESVGYRFGSLTLPAAGLGAPHGRHRTFFVADASEQRHDGRRSGEASGAGGDEQELERLRNAGVLLEHAKREGLSQQRGQPGSPRETEIGDARKAFERTGSPVIAVHPESGGLRINGSAPREGRHAAQPNGPCNGFWSDAQWIPCTDGKARAVKPQSLTVVDGIATDILRMCDSGFPLAKGAEARVLRLRGYGDGIVAPVAAAFIKAYLETLS